MPAINAMKTRVRIGACPLLCILQRRTFKEDIQAVEVRFGSFATETRGPREVRFPPDSDHIADVPACRKSADSVAKLPKCRGFNFPEIDQTSHNRERCSLQAIAEVACEFIADM